MGALDKINPFKNTPEKIEKKEIAQQKKVDKILDKEKTNFLRKVSDAAEYRIDEKKVKEVLALAEKNPKLKEALSESTENSLKYLEGVSTEDYNRFTTAFNRIKAFYKAANISDLGKRLNEGVYHRFLETEKFGKPRTVDTSGLLNARTYDPREKAGWACDELERFMTTELGMNLESIQGAKKRKEKKEVEKILKKS